MGKKPQSPSDPDVYEPLLVKVPARTEPLLERVAKRRTDQRDASQREALALAVREGYLTAMRATYPTPEERAANAPAKRKPGRPRKDLELYQLAQKVEAEREANPTTALKDIYPAVAEREGLHVSKVKRAARRFGLKKIKTAEAIRDAIVKKNNN